MTLGDLKGLINDLVRIEGNHVLCMDAYAEYDYGDHGHTRALVEFRDVQVLTPIKTAYSNSGLAVPRDFEDEEDREDEDTEKVVVLTS